MGRYRIVRELGRGAMGTVYEAEHDQLGRRVAIKALHSHLAHQSIANRRFLREGKAAAQIKSAHVVDVFDVDVHDGVPYLVMELLEGEDLAQRLRSEARLPLRLVVDLMLPILLAVSAAHAAGVIHRDLKPSNIFLARGERGELRPMVLDFGISKLADEAERDLTSSEALLGTVHYMSPEQTRGGRNASPQSDVYALGVILYECTTGRKPFSGASAYAVMHAIVSAEVQPPSSIVPALPIGFDEVVRAAMHPDLAQRTPSALALARSLLPWASEAAQLRWRTELDLTLDPAPVRKGRAPARRFAVATAVVTVLGVASLVTWRPGRQAQGESSSLRPVATESAVAFPRTNRPPPLPAAPVSIASPSASEVDPASQPPQAGASKPARPRPTVSAASRVPKAALQPPPACSVRSYIDGQGIERFTEDCPR
jgi:serine/threonine-protein kinase